MKKRTKKQTNGMRSLLLLLAGVFMLAFLPALNARAAKPLSEKDFVYKVNGKTYNFIKQSANIEANRASLYLPNTAKDSKDAKKYLGSSTYEVKEKNFPRGIIPGSTYRQVVDQFGSASKKKVKKTERIYKNIKYGIANNNVAVWKSYVEYQLKKSGDVYTIRFCMDKQDKVIALIYLKNADKFYNYPNKQFDSKVKFQTPNGEKVKTMTMNGQKVYVIPKGTKLAFGAFKNRQNYYHAIYLELYDKNGNMTANYPFNGYFTDYSGYDVQLEDLADKYMYKPKAKKPLNGKYGNYSFFVLWLYSSDNNPKPKMAPDMIYFRFK